MTDTIDAGRAAELLGTAVSSVFADMAFIDAQPLGNNPLDEEKKLNSGNADGNAQAPACDADDSRYAAIDVLTPLSCRILIHLDKSLLNKIVENLFGETPADVGLANSEDSLLEMLNIIAGSFLSAYFGAGAPIQLELPRYLYFGEQHTGTEVARVELDAEGERLSASLVSVRYRY